MSTATAARALPRPTPARETRPERRLRPVTNPGARRRPKLVYALIAMGGALAIGAAQIGMSLVITQDSYVLAGLRSQQRELNLQTHSLQEQLTGLSSPQLLASKAANLGMVVVGSASYLRLSDGAVFGTGDGASWISSVNPNGPGAVSNSLTEVPPPPVSETTEPGVVVADPTLPPPITDGLPSPTTH